MLQTTLLSLHVFYRVVHMGADLCPTSEGRQTVLGWVPPQCGSEGITPGKFVCQTVHFGEYLCVNWSTEWVNFALLNTGVETFFNQLSCYSYISVSREILPTQS